MLEGKFHQFPLLFKNNSFQKYLSRLPIVFRACPPEQEQEHEKEKEKEKEGEKEKELD